MNLHHVGMQLTDRQRDLRGYIIQIEAVSKSAMKIFQSVVLRRKQTFFFLPFAESPFCNQL